MADTSVKYFHSGMPGAPVLSGSAGCVIGILEACLVTGWGLKSVDSLVVVAGVATANISAGHSAEVGGVVLIAGATPSSLNGEWRVSSASTGTVKFQAPGVTDQTATGAVTLTLAPAGWAKPFSGANKAVFQQAQVESSGMFLRVNDAGTTACRAVGYQSMGDIDSGVDPFPSDSQMSGGLYWPKSEAIDATPRKWFVCADASGFYFGRNYYSYTPGVYDVAFFGDIASAAPVDPFKCAIFGNTDSTVSTPVSTSQLCYSYSELTGLFIARSASGLGGPKQLAKGAPHLVNCSTVNYPSGFVYGSPYPNPVDGALYVSPLGMVEGSVSSSPPYRGRFPGYFCCPQQIPPGTFAHGDVVENAVSGRTLKVVQSYYTTPPANQTSFLDITGPWAR